ncbi:copper resistance CopC/CopD family protein, partial [Lysinibacillus fusiformis]|uniref:copper resistance CopC/CopD family protein n=2 Tax=Bacillati TaxID=1783272 RepID=UPI0038172916
LGLPASAHADLLSSSPANGAVLAAVPQQVVLVFSDQVTSALSSVRVTGPDGQRADTGPAQDAPAESERLTTALAPDAHPGTYVLVWRATTAADGHTTTGTLTFSVGSQGHPAAAVPRPAHDAVTDAVLDTTVWLGLAGLALLVGGAALRFCRPRQPVAATGAVEPEGARWPRSLGWGVLLTATVAQLFVHGPAGQGHPVTKVFDRALLSATLETREGYALVARILLLAVVAAVGEALLRRPWGAGPAAVLALVLGTTWSATSHASTGSWQPLAVLSTTVHLTAMAVWAGGLFGMVLLLGSSGADADGERRATATRFSRLALIAVAVVAGTGLYQAFREVSGF